MPEVTKHPAGKLEIIAPVHIKKTLGLNDGDVITLRLRK
jgi:CTP-dependent riboflavin kinase